MIDKIKQVRANFFMKILFITGGCWKRIFLTQNILRSLVFRTSHFSHLMTAGKKLIVDADLGFVLLSYVCFFLFFGIVWKLSFCATAV